MEVDSDQLFDLREDLRRVVAFDLRIRAYEQGPVTADVAWTDAEPGWNPAPDSASLPDGYELRWWTPNRAVSAAARRGRGFRESP